MLSPCKGQSPAVEIKRKSFSAGSDSTNLQSSVSSLKALFIYKMTLTRFLPLIKLFCVKEVNTYGKL